MESELENINYDLNKESYKAKGLLSLPGGYRNYVKCIIKSLEKIKTNSFSRSDFVDWMKREFDLTGQRVPRYYLNLFFYLELVGDSEIGLKLSEVGERYLKTRDNEIILSCFLKNFAGIMDILTLLYSENATIEKVHKKLVTTHNFGWRTYSQTYARIKWLIALNYVEKSSETKYGLTVKGKEFIEKLAISKHTS